VQRLFDQPNEIITRARDPQHIAHRLVLGNGEITTGLPVARYSRTLIADP
jgi:hypothetical protein